MSFKQKLALIVDARLPAVEEARNSYTRSLQSWTRGVKDLLGAARDVLQEKVQGAGGRVEWDDSSYCKLDMTVDPKRLSQLGDTTERARQYTLRFDANHARRTIVVRAACDGSRSPLFSEEIDPRELTPAVAEEWVARCVEAVLKDLEDLYRPVRPVS